MIPHLWCPRIMCNMSFIHCLFHVNSLNLLRMFKGRPPTDGWVSSRTDSYVLGTTFELLETSTKCQPTYMIRGPKNAGPGLTMAWPWRSDHRYIMGWPMGHSFHRFLHRPGCFPDMDRSWILRGGKVARLQAEAAVSCVAVAQRWHVAMGQY